VSLTRKLLARIKALFEPSRPVVPPQEVEEPAPITVLEPPAAEEAPALVAAEARITVEEAPTLVEDAPTLLEEAPTVLEKTPTVAEQAMTDVEPMAPPAAGALTLRLETERGPRSTFEVMKSGATIGRGPESTIQLADLSVSRKHAKIIYKQGAYWLSDLGSMGGTWIDGTKLAAPRRVATGQIIDIGVCRLAVVSAGADEESPAAEGPSHATSGSSR
jgi:FHA domain-containing protein